MPGAPAVHHLVVIHRQGNTHQVVHHPANINQELEVHVCAPLMQLHAVVVVQPAVVARGVDRSGNLALGLLGIGLSISLRLPLTV
jgi:hypothetical protein